MTRESKPLKQEVEDLVESNGGWLNVMSRFTTCFDKAISSLGKPVDCPFPQRHKRSGGIDDFRLSDHPDYEGRAICTCMPDGMGPVDLLIEDGSLGGDYVTVMRKIRDGLIGRQVVVRRVAPVVVRRVATMSEDDVRYRKDKLSRIAKDLLPLNHPKARPARLYFKRRGIPLNAMIGEVKFHPALEYFHRVVENGEKVRKLVGRYPAVVSAFRSIDGRLVNLHKIYITEDGQKLETVLKPKKIDSPLPGFKGSSIAVATVQGCRTLHVTEGVEKAWAIHLATGQAVRAASSCSTLASLHVPQSAFDQVVIWADNDPRNEKTGKDGAGQTFAWRLFLELLRCGFGVTFMLPIVDHKPEAKGPDWEDLIVMHGVLQMPLEKRLPFLRSLAEEGGVYQNWKCKTA
jgi:hypothetical protein